MSHICSRAIGCWLLACTGVASAQQISVCVEEGTRVLRLPEAGGACKAGEATLTWNEKGPPGDAGPPGPAGIGITSMYSGIGQPETNLGQADDLYLHMGTGQVFRKQGNTWLLVASFRGPPGTDGASGAAGPQGPRGERGLRGLPGQDGISPVWAKVRSDGTVLAGSGVICSGADGDGHYYVGFSGMPADPERQCGVVATLMGVHVLNTPAPERVTVDIVRTSIVDEVSNCAADWLVSVNVGGRREDVPGVLRGGEHAHASAFVGSDFEHTHAGGEHGHRTLSHQHSQNTLGQFYVAAFCSR